MKKPTMNKLYFALFAAVFLASPCFAGEAESEHPHVERAADGKLRPAMGYHWVNDKDGDFSVHWVPGRGCEGHPNVYTAETEGRFIPHAGFVWSSAPDMQVSWMPGIEHPKVAHAFAMVRENFFLPEPGYDWDKEDNGIEVSTHHRLKWTPGISYPDLSKGADLVHIRGLNVVASDQEGMFIPAPGYTWVGGGREKRIDPQKVYRDKIKSESRYLSGACVGFRSVSPSEAAAVVAIFMGVREVSKALEQDIDRMIPAIQSVVNSFKETRGRDLDGGGGRETRESLSSPGGHSIPQ